MKDGKSSAEHLKLSREEAPGVLIKELLDKHYSGHDMKV